MKKKYNIVGRKDVRNEKLIKKIFEYKEKGLSFSAIARTLERSEKRVKEVYYREKSREESAPLDNVDEMIYNGITMNDR